MTADAKEQRLGEATPVDFRQTEDGPDYSVWHCPCGGSFRWSGFSDALASWEATHRPHLQALAKARISASEGELSITLPLSPNEDTEITCLYCLRPHPCEYGLTILRDGGRALVGLHAMCLAPFRAKQQRSEAASPEDASDLSCPCQHVTPCDPRCTCREPSSSRGCARCCRYGSAEQQRAKAFRLALAIDVPRSADVQSLRCAECETVTVPIPTCPECGDEYVSERSEAAWAARQRRESARNDAPERRQSEASVPLATPSASIACVHGAWNADGSCCTCGARGTAPWYRHAVYPKPGALSKEAQAAPPLPPDVLVSALQDRVHREVGAARPAKAVRVHEHDVDNRTEAALGREMPNACVEESPCVHEWVAGRSKPIVCQHCGIRRAEWVAGQIRADQRSADGPLVMMRSAGHNEPDDHGAEDLPPVKPFDPLTPREALDRLFNAAVSGGVGGVRACELFNVVRKALDAPR